MSASRFPSSLWQGMTKLSSGVSGIFISVKLGNYIADFARGVEAHFAVNHLRPANAGGHQ
jgi:hypothetical protein